MELNLRLLKLLLYMEPLPFTLLAGRQNLNPPKTYLLLCTICEQFCKTLLSVLINIRHKHLKDLGLKQFTDDNSQFSSITAEQPNNLCATPPVRPWKVNCSLATISFTVITSFMFPGINSAN